MEKGSGSWFQNQHCSQQSLDQNSVHAQFDLGNQSCVPTFINHHSEMIPRIETSPMFGSSGLPQTPASQTNEPHNWFCCLPRFHRAFTPLLNSLSKEGFPPSSDKNFERVNTPNGGSGSGQRRFLVFDHSGNQTNLIFRSGMGTPIHCLTSCCPNLPCADNLNRVDPVAKREIMYSSEHFLPAYEESDRDDISLLREDTEELDALLCSDDDYSEDVEETSTGHSPSTMMAYEKKEWPVESCEEIASSFGPSKRQKLSSGGCVLPALVDNAHLVEQNRCVEYEDDAESVCNDGSNQAVGRKRPREEEIHEVINVLRRIIPGGKGKDAIVFLDDAMHYLGSLKLEVKALGLSI